MNPFADPQQFLSDFVSRLDRWPFRHLSRPKRGRRPSNSGLAAARGPQKPVAPRFQAFQDGLKKLCFGRLPLERFEKESLAPWTRRTRPVLTHFLSRCSFRWSMGFAMASSISYSFLSLASALRALTPRASTSPWGGARSPCLCATPSWRAPSPRAATGSASSTTTCRAPILSARPMGLWRGGALRSSSTWSWSGSPVARCT